MLQTPLPQQPYGSHSHPESATLQVLGMESSDQSRALLLGSREGRGDERKVGGRATGLHSQPWGCSIIQ